MKQQLAHALLLTMALTSWQSSTSTTARAESTASTKIRYIMDTNEKPCDEAISKALIRLHTQNQVLFDTCVEESDGYKLLPYMGYIPNDDQIERLASSASCLYFMHGVLAVKDLKECNLGGIGLKSSFETLLMVSEDLIDGIPPLSTDQYLDFIKWRHQRNLAQENGEPYDSESTSAIEFDKQLGKSMRRFDVTLSSDLIITSKGQSIGGPASQDATVVAESEQRSSSVATTDTNSSGTTRSSAPTTQRSADPSEAVSDTEQSVRSTQSLASVSACTMALNALAALFVLVWV